MMKRFAILLVSLIALLPSSLLAPSEAGASSSFASIPSGYAFGDYAVISSSLNKLTSGPTAPVGLACTTAPTTVTNSASISLGSITSTGSAQSTISTSRTATSASIQVTSDIENLNILSGLITAERIHVAASSTATSAGATSTNNSTFTSLNIAGLPQGDPAPNTLKYLPGVGYVILNEQLGPVNGSTATSISVYGVDVFITLGLFAGSRLVFGLARSGETRTAQPDIVTASAYGLYANGLAGSGSSSIGPLSSSGINCAGGSSQNSVSGFNSLHPGNAGAMSSSASGQITSAGASATSQATVLNPNLLGGLISAGSMTSMASASWNGAGSRSGSVTLTSGKIAGAPLSHSPVPNTRINLAGIGYVIVNEQYGSSNAPGAAETVIAFDIYITQSNSLGLPKGARILVGVATASAMSQ